MTRGARRCPLSAAAPGRSCCRRPAHQPVSSASSRFCVRRGSPRPRPRRHSAWRQDARGAAPAGQRQSVHWRHAGAHARARQGSRPRHRGARRHRASLLVVGVLALLAHFARRRTEREGEGPRPSHHRFRPRCPHAAARPRRATHALWRRCGAHDHPQSSPRAAARWRTKFGEAKKKTRKEAATPPPRPLLGGQPGRGGAPPAPPPLRSAAAAPSPSAHPSPPRMPPPCGRWHWRWRRRRRRRPYSRVEYFTHDR